MSASYKMPAEAAPLVELIPVADVFAVGLASIRDLGDYVRLVFFADHELPGDADGLQERVIVAKIVMPPNSFTRMRRQINASALPGIGHADLAS